MEITEKLINELQNRLKVGNRRGVHLNAIPSNSRYKFDITRLSHIDKDLPNSFINALLSEQPLNFKISWKDNVPDLNSLLEEDQTQLVKITKSFENLINQTQAIESEKGINTFGFGFPLLVRKDKSDNKLTVAPILIWSLKIKRSKEFNTWVVHRNEDDPIYVNEVLINHLQSDSQVQVEQLSSDFLDDGLIDKEELLDVCTNLIECVNGSSPENLRTTFSEKLNNIKSISSKKHFESLPLTWNNSFIEFGGLFSIFEVQKQNIIQDYEAMNQLEGSSIDLEEMKEHYFQPISSVQTDPSQQGILNSLAQTRNILIQGPPGTGKSQSLTAILINALENKKKTIVVCEKINALEVLKKALDERGLSDLNVQITEVQKSGRRDVVYSVRDRIENTQYRRYRYKYSKTTLESIQNKAESLIEDINKRHRKLDEKLIGNDGWVDIVGNLLKESKGIEEDFDLALTKDFFTYETDEFNEILEVIRNGNRLYKAYHPNSGKSFINSVKLIGDNPYSIEQALEEDFSHYKNSYHTIKILKGNYRIEYLKIRASEINHQTTQINFVINDIERILKEAHTLNDFFNEEVTGRFGYKVLSLFSKEKKHLLETQQELNRLLERLSKTIHNCKDFEYSHKKESASILEAKYRNFHSGYLKFIEESTELLENEFNSLNLAFRVVLSPKRLGAKYQTVILGNLQSAYGKIASKIISDNWCAIKIDDNSASSIEENVEQILKVYDLYFSDDNDLFSIEFKWFNYFNTLTDKNKEIINLLLPKTDWTKVFTSFYFNALLVNSANNDLPTNDGDHSELTESLSLIENEQLKYIREYWFSKQIDATRKFEQKNSNISVENLYNKRKSNRHKRLSLRQIVKFDINLFTTFFPVILTTPDVCSNLFKGMDKYFDIVMFDEASQLRLEDNLPALLKGKQIIIAGDEHQMPPSNYFSKIFDGSLDDEDEFDEDEEITIDKDNEILSCESLLQFGEELKFDKKYLDFHYRSKHPFLIDFSNFAFYQQRLKPLPFNFDYVPIKYINVNGTYADTSNDAEAEAVLTIIEKNINRLPDGKYPSVGIATFNIHQRNLILSKINDRRKFDSYSHFNEKIIELEEDGLFVKNLENIQGDERDVIILSTTYGSNQEGKFNQRFGAINHQKGYKLLNVIITRAKYKIYVCSSIPEKVFLNYNELLVTEGSNNRRAVFYAYLAYCKAVSENDNEKRLSILNNLALNAIKKKALDNLGGELESPFEEEVYYALTEHIDESKLIPQLSIGGFRIDMVYDSRISWYS